jgi:large subunit ribosomal protein L2
MAKKIKPVTPGLRFRIAPSFDKITTSTPEKSLLTTLKKSGGRNSGGKMTVRNVGSQKQFKLLENQSSLFKVTSIMCKKSHIF